MARVNVEQQALTDARFKRLGELLGGDHRLALGHMIYIWNECQERDTYTLSNDELRLLSGVENFASALVQAGLGTKVKGGRTRIKGTNGRIEWLAKARQNGRKGGRPKRRDASENETTRLPSGSAQKNPPAPAPAPAPALEPSPSDARRTMKRFEAGSAELDLSQFLLAKIRERNPKHREPDLQKWARDVDLMIRLDGREPADIRRMIEWAQQDSFWSANILSTAKLREQFDQLLLKANAARQNATRGYGDFPKVVPPPSGASGA